uniref:Serine/threonine-protein phosphatase 4 regulatory subunit 2 n=2 Tax=Lygus hesperus TaxID=30085 RepID=A0A0A9YAT1_LYGHE
MDNAEEIMQCLEEFSKMKPKDIPHELDDYLGYVAKTGDPVFKWSIIKCLFREKLVNVITDFYESTLSIELPPCPNVDPFNYERMKANLLEKLDSFQGAPFTVQRISELLTNPKKEYNRADKFMRAIEKNILVVSTREPGRFAEGESENDPSYNGIPDANDSGVETGFPCNDLADPDATPQPYVSTENVEPAYNVNVDSIDTPGTSVLSGAAQEVGFIAAPEPREGLDVPSTSGETKAIETAADNMEAESVICSTLASTVQEQTADNVEPLSSTTEEPTQIHEPAVETPVPSTSEADPVNEPIAEPEPSTSKSNLERERLVEEASSSQVEEESSNPQPAVEEMDSSQEAIPVEEPSLSGSENLASYAETEDEVPVVSSNDEVELECKEAASAVDERSECDTYTGTPESHAIPVVETPTADEKKVEEKSEPQVAAEVPGDVGKSEDDKVTSCADSSSETSPDVQGSGDHPREASVIHTTSPDEAMDVDECQTSSSEQSQP